MKFGEKKTDVDQIRPRTQKHVSREREAIFVLPGWFGRGQHFQKRLLFMCVFIVFWSNLCFACTGDHFSLAKGMATGTAPGTATGHRYHHRRPSRSHSHGHGPWPQPHPQAYIHSKVSVLYRRERIFIKKVQFSERGVKI